MHGGLANDELSKAFGQKTLDAASARWRHGTSLQEMILDAAGANGYRGRQRITRHNGREVMDYALGLRRDGASAAHFSTGALPEAFGGTMEKFLVAGYESVERAWPEVFYKRPGGRDFRPYKGITVTALDIFEPVGSKGEIKHGDPARERHYTNQVERQGRIIGISDMDIIDDNLGVLTDVPRRLGTGGARTLNRILWSAFLRPGGAANNDAFFNQSGLAGVRPGTLNVDSLAGAIKLLRNQKDASGEPYDLQAAILLVGPENENSARQLLEATKVQHVTVNATIGEQTIIEEGNPIKGLRLVVTNRIEGPEWYVLADPRDVFIAEVAFLDGQETPMVQQDRAPFDVFGIQYRAYLDVGATLVDPRAGIKASGTGKWSAK